MFVRPGLQACGLSEPDTYKQGVPKMIDYKIYCQVQFNMFQRCVLVLMNPLPIALEEDLQRRSSSAVKLNWIAFDNVSVIRLLKETRQCSG
ncbi:uncharacterized [Tachysurus ichikawai]